MKGLLKRKESMSISKDELLKKKYLQFVQFKRFAFTKIAHSYSHPYLDSSGKIILSARQLPRRAWAAGAY